MSTYRRPEHPTGRGSTLTRAGVAGLGGVALASAFELSAGGLVAPLALAVLFLTVTTHRTTGASAATAGYAFGAGFFGVHLWWLTSSIGWPAWWALVLVLPLWTAAVAAAVALVRRHPTWPLVAATMWSAAEVLRSSWPLGGMPWGQVAVTAIDTPWAQYLPNLGSAGTSFVVALLGSTTAAALRLAVRRRAGAAAAATAALVLVGAGAWAVPGAAADTGGGSATIAVVQGEVPGDGTAVVAYHRRITATIADRTRSLVSEVEAGSVPSPDLVVWPESSIIVDPTQDAIAGAEVRRATRGLDAPLLLGGIVDGPSPGTAYNRSLVWADGGPTGQTYTKAHPVPFGEYIPFRAVVGGLSPRFAEIPRDMLPGRDPQPLKVGDLTVASAICFDIAYRDPLLGQVADGADLIVVQTSNAAFTGTRQLRQQFAISRARALETGRTVVVSSLNGLSGIIGPDGKVEDVLPERLAATLVREVEVRRDITPAITYGDDVAAGLVGAAALILVVVPVGSWRRRRRSVAPQTV